jgi:hypothetical protein
VPDTRDIRNIRARLERWELTHLRALAANLNEKLEDCQLRLEQAESWAKSLEFQADMLREELMQLCDASGTRVGLTQDGEVFVVQQGGAA